jgi:hypothetical protein
VASTDLAPALSAYCTVGADTEMSHFAGHTSVAVIRARADGQAESEQALDAESRQDLPGRRSA